MFGAGYRSTPRRRYERAVSLVVGDRLEEYSTLRRCRHPECEAVLSRYNPAPTCSRHGGWQAPKEPGRRPRRHVL